MSMELDSVQLETIISKEFKQKQPVSVMLCRLDATSLVVPNGEEYPERRLYFIDTEHKDKALLYRLVVAAYNYTHTNEFASLSSKELFSRASSEFVDWLNTAVICNRYNILKDYEAHMFDKRGNHGSASELRSTKRLFTYAYRDDEFNYSLSAEELSLIAHLKQTKESPNLNKKQVSLASYFGSINWLRDEQLGVGTKLYNVFASPKLTVNSLKGLAATVIIELYEIKKEFRAFLTERDLMLDSVDLTGLSPGARRMFVARQIHDIICAYYEVESPSELLQNAMEILWISNSQDNNKASYQKALAGKNSLKDVFYTKRGEFTPYKEGFNIKSAESGPLFSIEFLRQLSKSGEPLPITPLENLMFKWLMASLTVQPYDIPKLTKADFREFRVGGRVTHIECEYFKGRANAIHNTRTLSVKKDEGRALLSYLNQHQTDVLIELNNATPTIGSSNNSVVGSLVDLIGLSSFDKALTDSHQRLGDTPMIIPQALKALVYHGIHTLNIPNVKNLNAAERLAGVAKSDTPCSTTTFGLQAIKNSAVHAYSDPYTLHYLINRNSHTNLTERLNYLNEGNNAWMDAAGGVTRSVMIDLINNVFDLDFSELASKKMKEAKEEFNDEFESVTNEISYKRSEMLSRLKVVTEQEKGIINEVGIMSLSANSEGVFAPIYVLDSPVTVCKMKNYLHEFKLNYKRLSCQNPDHLYKTALPTVEWIEGVLSKLSKVSVTEGLNMFEKMKQSGVVMQVFHSL